MPGLSGNTYGIIRSDRGYFLLGRSAAGGTGGVVLPLQDGSGVSFPPKFLDVPGTANNVQDVSYYNGLYYPSVRTACDVISTWFTTANLNAWFFQRGILPTDLAWDDLSVVPGGAIYSDGHRAIGLLGIKGDSFMLSSRQGDILRCQLSFLGASKSEIIWENVATVTGKRAAWDSVTFVSGVSGVTDFSLSVMNGTGPNPIIGDGAGTAVTEINAGKVRFELSLTVDARGVPPAMGVPIVFTVLPPGGTLVTFTVTTPRIDDPDNVRKQGVRTSQSYQVTAESADGNTNGIIVS